MPTEQPTSQPSWHDVEEWWVGMARRLGVEERGRRFFSNLQGQDKVLARLHQLGANIDYILFVLLRYWSPAVLPPPGRERLSKNDQDYWVETQDILTSAVVRLQEIKPLLELLTSTNPMVPRAPAEPAPVCLTGEGDVARTLEGLADVVGSYGGPDYTSVIKNFDPIPMRQTQPFKHNKKNSAELWLVFLLREHIHGVGLGKHRCWPFIADLISAAGIHQPGGLSYTADELKSWWQKNWPRTYTQHEQKNAATGPSAAAYQHDFEWFQAWFHWQMTRPVTSEG